MLDGNSFAKTLATGWCCDKLAEAMLELFILCDADGAPVLNRGHRAARAHGTLRGDVRVELDDRARGEVLDLASGTANGLGAHIDLEVGLREELSVARHPRLAEHEGAALEHVLNKGAADVAAIDMEFPDVAAVGMAREVVAQDGRRLLLGAIGWRDRARENQIGVEVGGDVALVAFEPLALALATMPHLAVFDGDAPVRSDSLSDAGAAAGGLRIEVLLTKLVKWFEVIGERRSFGLVRKVPVNPSLKGIELFDEHVQSLSLLLRVAPFDIERSLDTRARRKERRPRGRRNFLHGAVEQCRDVAEDLACRVGQQIHRVLDATRPFQRHRVDGHTKVLRELLPVEALRAPRELRRALQQAPIHIVGDETLAEVAERSLRKRWPRGAEAVEDL